MNRYLITYTTDGHTESTAFVTAPSRVQAERSIVDTFAQRLGETVAIREVETREAIGTFVQNVPGPGRTWHRVDGSTLAGTVCGAPIILGRSEYDTSDTMPAWKVCAECLEGGAR